MSIKSLWRKLFPPKQLIEPGQVWMLRSNSPWPKEYSAIRILDCKDGWVRYAFGRTKHILLQDERMEEKIFRRVYVPTGDTVKL